MRFKKIISTLFWAISFGLIAILPLIVDGKYTSPYETPKIILVSYLVLFLLSGISFKIFITKQKVNLVSVIFTFVFLFFAYFNIKFAIVPARSFIGDNMFNDSFVLFLIYFCLLFAVANSGKSKEFFVKALITSGLLLSLITIWHAFLLYTGQTDISYDGRVTATIGQPNLLGGILVGFIPLSCYFLSKKRSKTNLIAYCVFIILLTAGLIPMSRGAIIALGVFVIVQIYIALKTIKRRNIFITVITLLCLSVIIMPPIDTEKTNLPYLAERLLSFKDRNQIYDFRVEIWQVGLRAFLDRPVLGWGNANFQNVYQQVVDITIDDKSTWFREVESSHNIIVDILVEWGLIGFILATLFLIYIFKLKSTKDARLDLYIKLSIVVIVIKGMFEFFSVVNWVTLFILFGLLLQNSKFQLKKYALSIVITILFVIFAIVGVIYVRKSITAEKYERLIKSEGDLSKVINYYQTAIAQNPYKQSLVDNYIGILYWSGDYQKMYDETQKYYDRFNDHKLNTYLARYHMINRDNAKSIEYYLIAHKLNKRDPQITHQLGMLFYQQKNYQNSYYFFEYTTQLDAKNFSDDYVYMADILIRQKDYENAKKQLDKSAPSHNKQMLKQMLKTLMAK